MNKELKPREIFKNHYKQQYEHFSQNTLDEALSSLRKWVEGKKQWTVKFSKQADKALEKIVEKANKETKIYNQALDDLIKELK